MRSKRGGAEGSSRFSRISLNAFSSVVEWHEARTCLCRHDVGHSVPKGGASPWGDGKQKGGYPGPGYPPKTGTKKGKGIPIKQDTLACTIVLRKR